MDTKIPRTLFFTRIQPLSVSNCLWILAVVLLIGGLQFGIPLASAAAHLWTRGIDTNTLLAPSTVCPPSMGFGETIQCSIVSAGETDTYTFAANASDKVLVRMISSSWDLWPGIRVHSPDGTKLCETYSSSIAEIASCTLTSTETYSILAYDDWDGTGTGDYYLYLQRLNNPGSPVSIAFGQTHSGSIMTPAEIDTYTFAANAGDKVLVRMSGGTVYPPPPFYPGIRVYSPDGTKLCEEHDAITAETASCTLTSTGTYTILTYDHWGGTSTGDYYLYLQRLNNPGSPVAITFGQTLSGSIMTLAEMDTYTFAASAGDKVLVRMSKSSGTLYPEIRVYSPDGTKLCEENSLYAAQTDTAEIASCSLTSTGTYSILADDGHYGTYTGDYYLYLQLTSKVYLPQIARAEPPTPTPTPCAPAEDMALIPAGTFQMGCDPEHNGGRPCEPDELPLHTVYLNAYRIDRTEVTTVQYMMCVKAGVCIEPNGQRHANPAYACHPVVWVGWRYAHDYCQWVGKRLPTEAEWEKAARGATGTRVYPWGDEAPNCSLANVWIGSGGCVGDTAPVGSYPACASPYGVLDMAGNAWEWTNDWYQEDYYSISPGSNPQGPGYGPMGMKSVRGGDFGTTDGRHRLAYRWHMDSGGTTGSIGFRCAAAP